LNIYLHKQKDVHGAFFVWAQVENRECTQTFKKNEADIIVVSDESEIEKVYREDVIVAVIDVTPSPTAFYPPNVIFITFGQFFMDAIMNLKRVVGRYAHA